MSSFVFNSFKERYLKGEVPTKDTWAFIPVAKNFREQYEFNDVRLDQYRSLSDFMYIKPGNFKYDCDLSGQGQYIKGKVRTVNVTDKSFRLKGYNLIDGCIVGYRWSKTTHLEKPQYITKENSASFMSFYSADMADNGYTASYINSGGFYYIQSKGELDWFADRSLVNDRIIGVFGNDLTACISKPIGDDEKIPFNGIIDGNYHRFDLQIKGRSTDCGLVGVLGKDGTVRNFRLKGKYFDNTMECDKQITLNHIKKDGRDINCGLLVGRNYGVVENVDADLDHFTLYGFVPSIYSVTNKSDKYKWNEKTAIVRDKFDYDRENFFYLNSFCINSPGNICPYVGYFNEGKFADNNEAMIPETLLLTGYNQYFLNLSSDNSAATWHLDSRTETEGYQVSGKLYYPILGNFYKTNNNAILTTTDILYDSNYNEKTNEMQKFVLSHNPLYYGVDVDGIFTTKCIGSKSTLDNLDASGTYTVNYNTNLLVKSFGDNISANTGLNPSYEVTRNSLRLHPQARAAYNVGVIIGSNLGSAWNINVNTTVTNTTNFVGFIGGIAGKQSQGQISNVSVYVDYKLNYDLGTKPELGDVAYYKQTPIFPEIIKEDFDSHVSKYNNDDGNKRRNAFIYDYFSAWNLIEGASADTAANIMDDVIQYKLRPIFVAGGLFGRFVPNNPDKNSSKSLITNVTNATVIYKDNYNSTNIEKRPENAFGVLAGKVDYSITNNGFYYRESMYCNNCKFSAISNVGEPFPIIDHTFQDNYWSPITNQNSDGTYSLNSGYSTKRYVGVYELKNNVFDPLSFIANNNASGTGTSSLNNYYIYYAGDYPIDLSSHSGGIIKTHSLWPQIANATSKDVTEWITLSGTGEVNDWFQKYYNEPNVDITNTSNYYAAVGHNKRNMASKLITLNNNCYSNLDSYIQVYDNYINQWDLMKIPESRGLYFNSANNNKFSNDDIILLKAYWTRSHGKTNTVINHWSEVSAYMNASGTIMSGMSEDSAASSWSGYFNWGMINEQINPLIKIGTENAFDGYTTTFYSVGGDYSSTKIDYITDSASTLDSTKCNCYDSATKSWGKAKTYRKNIMPHKNGNFYKNTPSSPITPVNSLPKNFVFNRKPAQFAGEYGYQTITSNRTSLTAGHTIEEAFGFTLPIQFKKHGSSYGYCFSATQDEKETSNYINLTLGEYVTPRIIYSALNDGTRTSYTTTAVSSQNGFGGILVVDSSGRNVMFLDNDNGLDLTGNVISYPTFNTQENKYILEIE